MPMENEHEGCGNMTRIAICEDDEMERTVLQELVKAWAEANDVEVFVSSFASGEELIWSFSDRRYDILFLDILLIRWDTDRTADTFHGCKDGYYLLYGNDRFCIRCI